MHVGVHTRPLSLDVCAGGEIKRKSRPVDVRTGSFQRCIPQPQLAGCACEWLLFGGEVGQLREVNTPHPQGSLKSGGEQHYATA